MNKADFLSNISRRLGRIKVPAEAPQRDVVGVPEFWAETQLPATECLVRFQERLTQLGGEVQVVKDVDALRVALARMLEELGPHRIGIWDDARLNEWADPVLGPYEVLIWGTDASEEFTTTDVGITGCAFAIADTGTLVLACGAGRGRSVHLLPPVHIAVVGASQIRTRLGEALKDVSKQLPHIDSYIHFITGPSRSSDIENDQSIGVHGPAAEMVIIVENQ